MEFKKEKNNLGHTMDTEKCRLSDRTVMPCFSCSRKTCNGFQKVFVDNIDRELKTSRFVQYCPGYREQKFRLSKKQFREIQSLVESLCSKNVMSKHNITQSNDGWDEMILELSLGIARHFIHRGSFNKLREIGSRISEANSFGVTE